MKLSQKQRDELWGEDGPYSEIRLSIETRILDDNVSRIFIVVEASINPFTYKIIKKNRDEFIDDPMIQQLLDHADYRGQKNGYVTCAFNSQLTESENNEDIMDKAQACVEYTKKTLIKMHQYVLNIIDNYGIEIPIKIDF